MVEIDPVRQAQQEWEQAQKYLAVCLEVWRGNPRPDEAMRLAYAYDEERTLFDIYEEKVIDSLWSDASRA